MTGKWRRPSACASGECAEVRRLDGGGAQVRNSADPDVVLTFTRGEWEAFAAGCRDGEFGGLTGLLP